MSEPAIPIFRSIAAGPCFEHALVLEARGFDYELRADGTGIEIAVAPEDADRARRELDEYHRENAPAPAPTAQRLYMSGGGAGVAGYLVALLLITWLDDRTAFGRDWFQAGRLEADLVRAGEWWRTITALTLHGDAGHLLGNLAYGGLIGYAAGQLLGSGVAWFSILLAGALGNAINAFVQAPTFTSIGASTAVFGALGIVSAYLLRHQRRLGGHWAQRWAALVAGAVLLALFGVGGDRTEGIAEQHVDIVAHLTGFASGTLIGWTWGMLGHRAPRPSAQAAFGVAAVVLLVAAWGAALSSRG
jgi:membrane associated rhomboid family serine protease